MSDYGLFPAGDFLQSLGGNPAAELLPQARWYFREQWIAVPRSGLPRAGFDPCLSLGDDLRDWARATPLGAPAAYPPLIWLGAPEVLADVRLTADGLTLQDAVGETALRLAPRLALNSAWFDASSIAFFHGRPLKLLGKHEPGAFVARVFWPLDFRLPASPLPLAVAPGPLALRALVRAEPRGGARSPFAVQSLWRRPGSGGAQPGQPLIALMLNGAQGDDDEAHGGHFAVITGRVGEDGAMDGWLVNNLYPLDSESEKGILAGAVPLANYLGDLNGGQAWYRPSCLLVATLREARTANYLQSAFGRVFNQYYRHQIAFQHARANCAGISVSAARALGWRVPVRGAEGWLKAIFALPWMALRERSLHQGKMSFDYLTEDGTRLYPAAAFEEMGADLLRLAAGQGGRELSEFEQCLADDIDEILFVRLPQFPSSRAWGDCPVVSTAEFAARLHGRRADQQIIPLPPRPFPAELRDPRSPKAPPLRSDYAVALWGIALLAALLLLLRQLLA